ncbi:hypothetical protein C0V82_26040 (plasmid) [Niveispirillum cyanobacteriorum]|uniref:Uncharacterized protein n=1 Tax=Niveispirillum cyanobacteriorum TaxID=1612173 RepID=A0A2K9NLE3_9PROT|nr:hypothetical protein C0V82_26040 [Niveispirillum cyanobacteriorum]
MSLDIWTIDDAGAYGHRIRPVGQLVELNIEGMQPVAYALVNESYIKLIGNAPRHHGTIHQQFDLNRVVWP